MEQSPRADVMELLSCRARLDAGGSGRACGPPRLGFLVSGPSFGYTCVLRAVGLILWESAAFSAPSTSLESEAAQVAAACPSWPAPRPVLPHCPGSGLCGHSHQTAGHTEVYRGFPSLPGCPGLGERPGLVARRGGSLRRWSQRRWGYRVAAPKCEGASEPQGQSSWMVKRRWPHSPSRFCHKMTFKVC